MRYTPTQYATALHDLLAAPGPKKESERVKEFALFLYKNGDTGKLGEIEQSFRKLLREKEGKVLVEMTVTESATAKVPHTLLGKPAEVILKEDKTIVGGVRFKIEDVVVDNTLRGRMNTLKKAIGSHE